MRKWLVDGEMTEKKDGETRQIYCIKEEETLRQRAKQALDIALTVLTGEGEAVTSESDED